MKLTSRTTIFTITSHERLITRDLLHEYLLRWRDRVFAHLSTLHTDKIEQVSEQATKMLLQVVITWMYLEAMGDTEILMKTIERVQHDTKRKKPNRCSCLPKLSYEILIQYTSSNHDHTKTDNFGKTTDDSVGTSSELRELLSILNDEEWNSFLRLPCSFFYTLENYPSNNNVPILELLILARKTNTCFDGYFLGNLHQSCMKMKDRKSKGIYYTPPSITQEIVEKSLQYFLQFTTNLVPDDIHNFEDWSKFFDKMNYRQLVNAFQALMEIKILDPACGSGHFLETSLNLLLQLIAIVWKKIKKFNDLEEFQGLSWHQKSLQVPKNVLEFINIQSEEELQVQYLSKVLLPHALHGMDLDPLAVKISRIRLFLKSILVGSRFSLKNTNFSKIIPPHVTCMNALLDSSLTPSTFNIIIGNPPYGRSVLTATEKNALTNTISCLNAKNPKKRSFNAAALFIEKSLQLIKDGGILGFIVPQSITRVEEYECLREKILENAYILEIIDKGSPFNGVTLETIAIFLQKKKIDPTPERNLIDLQSVRIVSHRSRMGHQFPMRTRVEIDLYKKFKRFFLYVDEFFKILINEKQFNVIQGDYGLDHRRVSKDLRTTPSLDYSVPFLHSGKAVKKYYLDEEFFSWSRKHEGKRFNELMHQQSIVTTAIAMRPRAALKPPGIVPGTNVSIQRVVGCPQLHAKTAIIILNSDLIGYYLHRYVLNYSQLTVYLHKYYTKLIPIVIPKSQRTFKNLHDYIVTLRYLHSKSFLPPIQHVLTEMELCSGHLLKMLHYFEHVIAETLVLELYLSEWLEKEGLGLDLTKNLDQHLRSAFELSYSSWESFRLSFYNEKYEITKRLEILHETYSRLISQEFIGHHVEKMKDVLRKAFGFSCTVQR